MRSKTEKEVSYKIAGFIINCFGYYLYCNFVSKMGEVRKKINRLVLEGFKNLN